MIENKSDMIGKKLLILGANLETRRLVESAKELGVKTIVTDYDDNAPAKKYSDEAVNIDCKDLPALQRYVFDNEIDGILVGVADTIVPYYSELCKITGLYSYANKFQCDYLCDKSQFNMLLEKFELPIIPNFNCNDRILEIDRFPILVKPEIGSGSKGVSICHEAKEINRCVALAKGFSENGKALVERFMDCDDLMIFLTIIDGEAIVHGIGDRHKPINGKFKSPVYSGITYPSKHINTYFRNWHKPIKKLIKFLGLRNAVLTVSAFVEEGQFYFYDPGFRIQGEAPDIHFRSQKIFDQLQFLIELAIAGENLSQKDYASKFTGSPGYHAATVCVQLGKGVIASVDGLDKVQKLKSCFNISQRLSEGCEITEAMIGTEKQIFARIYLKAETNRELKYSIKEVFSFLTIKNQSNENMINHGQELMSVFDC